MNLRVWCKEKLIEILKEMIATAKELREASKIHRLARQEKSKEELLASWVKNFEKAADRAIKEAVRVGLEQCSIQLPWQPGKNTQKFMQQTKIEGMDLREWVKQHLPECEVAYMSEEMEEEEDIWFVLEINWESFSDSDSDD